MPSTTMDFLNAKTIVDAVRKRHAAVAGEDPIGVIGAFCKDLAIDETAGNRDIVGIATTDDIDLEDEVVVPAGADWSYLLANRKLFVDHDYCLEKCVGVLRSLSPYPSAQSIKGWKFRAHIFKSSATPYPDMVLDVARQAGISLSIGFKPLDWGKPTAQEQLAYPGVQSIVRKWRGLEITFTGMPMNSPCQGELASQDKPTRRMALKSRAEALRKVLDNRKAAPEAYAAFGLEPPKPRRLVVVTGSGLVN